MTTSTRVLASRPGPQGVADVIVVKRKRRAVPKTVWVSLAIIVTAVVVALLGDAITPYRYSAQTLTQRLWPPVFIAEGSSAHLLGTDALGRDVLSRLMVGLRASLGAGFGGVAVACVLGTTVGLLAGYFRGWTENILMMLVDVKLALPGILLAIGIIAVFGSSAMILILVIGLGLWVGFARVVRSMVVRLRNEEFVLAARAVGAREPRIIVKHILPNCVTPILVLATLDVPSAIALEASLSFLGIGIQAPLPSLGNMIAEGRGYLEVNPWQVVVPALSLIVLTLSVSRVGDWVSSVLDPSSSAGVVH